MIRKPTTTSGLVGLGQPGGQAADVGDLELAVAVGERDEVVAGGGEAGAKRRAVAEVRRVVDRPDDAGVGRRQRVGEGRRAVLRAVVDRDDLERVGEGRQRLERLLHEALEVGLLVVGREEVGQARDAGREGRLRVGHPRIVRARPFGPFETRWATVRRAEPRLVRQPGFL